MTVKGKENSNLCDIAEIGILEFIKTNNNKNTNASLPVFELQMNTH